MYNTSTSDINENEESTKSKSSIKMPDTLIILLTVAFLVSLLTYFVPVGSFQTNEVSFSFGGTEQVRSSIVPGSFSYALDDSGNYIYNKVGLFSSDGTPALANFAFSGMKSAMDIIVFILVTGGAFGIVMQSGGIDRGIMKLLQLTRGNDSLFIIFTFLIFSLGGATFGMGEEAAAFIFIITPIMIRMGYDGITSVMTTLVATQIGFATSWMNPFNVAIAQGIAGIPVFSGTPFRIALWIIFTLFGIVFTLRYARQIKHSPTESHSYATDTYFRNKIKEDCSNIQKTNSISDIIGWVVLVLTMGWLVWGVVVKGYYIPEIAALFFVMGIVIGVAAVVDKRNTATANKMAQSFNEGAKALLPAAMLIGLAKGVVLMLGGSAGPETPSVLNTILNGTSALISGLPAMMSAWLMMLFQSIFNFFVTSGSGQAALTIPLLAPLSDLAGISRQIAVLTFQLGDGLTNIIVPTSAVLMAALGAARVEWSDWIKFSLPLIGWLMGISLIAVTIAQLIGYA